MTENVTIQALPVRNGDALWMEWGPEDMRSRMVVDGGPIGGWSAFKQRVDTIIDDQFIELLVITHVDTDHAEGVIKLLADKQYNMTIEDIWHNGWHHLEEEDVLGGRQGEFISALIQMRGYSDVWNKAFLGRPVVIPETGPLPKKPLNGVDVTLISPTQDRLRRLRSDWKRPLKNKITPGDLESAIEDLSKDKKYLPEEGLILGSEGRMVDLLKDTFDASTSNANRSSIAFLTEHPNVSCLFLGDSFPDEIIPAIERLIEERGLEYLEVDCFKVSHHGSMNNITKELLDLVRAKYFIVSTDGSAGHDHPDIATIELIIDHPKTVDPVICFNYFCPSTKKWSDPDDQAARGYTSMYPDDDFSGIVLRFGENGLISP